VERFDFPGEEDAPLVDYLENGEAERILLAGAKRVRLVRRTKGGPKHQSDRPRWLLLSEWAQRPALDDVGSRLASRLGDAISRQSFFVGHRLYPWVDRPGGVPAQSSK
jgi:hypothetical protein